MYSYNKTNCRSKCGMPEKIPCMYDLYIIKCTKPLGFSIERVHCKSDIYLKMFKMSQN